MGSISGSGVGSGVDLAGGGGAAGFSGTFMYCQPMIGVHIPMAIPASCRYFLRFGLMDFSGVWVELFPMVDVDEEGVLMFVS
jgi:hypothetical protein